MSGGGGRGPGSGGGGDSGSDAEDLRVPSSSPFGGSTGSGGGKHSIKLSPFLKQNFKS